MTKSEEKAIASSPDYDAAAFGGETEKQMMIKFESQLQDGLTYFKNVIRPRLDRSYKLYMSYTGDREKAKKPWQANIFVPYINSAVETLMPRILDARPEFTTKGRNIDDEEKSTKQNKLMDFTWEMSEMDRKQELVVRSSLVYGTGFWQVYWKKDVVNGKFLDTKSLYDKKLVYKDKEIVRYDGPCADHVDNYSLLYDWHNVERKSKQYWIKRLILSAEDVKKKYPYADKKRLLAAFKSGSGDLEDFGKIRTEIKTVQESVYKGAKEAYASGDSYNDASNADIKMYEVFEWLRPLDDQFGVIVGAGHVPILKGASIPFPYDFKETPFIEVPYLKLPGEFEGIGLPLLLENPQLMLNLIKNQRLDAATLGIHKMWIVNPLSNINKNDLVVRPFGIIWTPDPSGVREVQFSDVKPSAYREEELLKNDLRYSSGVDDFSMGAGGGAGSATEVRHLRESTLERVRLFVNHLGESYSDIMRYWMDMYRQFFNKKFTIRVTGDGGSVEYPLIEKDDFSGKFDYIATVLPSFAGQNDIKKKQDMDLFQLLITQPWVDPKKLVSKVLHDFNWSVDSVSKGEGEGEMPPMPGEMMPGMPGMEGQPEAAPEEGTEEGMEEGAPIDAGGSIPPEVLTEALGMLRKEGETVSRPGGQFSEASLPIDLLRGASMPPTVKGVPGGANPRGLNRGGAVNTDVRLADNSNPEAALQRRATSLQ